MVERAPLLLKPCLRDDNPPHRPLRQGFPWF